MTMCFATKTPKPADPPPVAAGPVRSDEAIKRATQDELDMLRRRKGRSETTLTGGLGDTGYGQSISAKTMLGQ